MKNKLLISFSGGRTSGFMAKWLLDNKKEDFDMIVCFANTGKERPETLDFINKCDIEFGFNTVWIESVTNMEYGKGVGFKVVDYNSASRNGEPFIEMIKKHGIPNQSAPKCTRELKTYAINAYRRHIGWKGNYTAIGIRSDEIDRMNPERKKIRYIYPLITMIPSMKSDINKFWSKQSFDLGIKSYEGNCDLCWKKSEKKLLTLLREKPELADWWIKMEDEYENFIPGFRKGNGNQKIPVRFFRDNKSIKELIAKSKLPFSKAVDDSKVIDPYRQMDLYEFGCSESCEAF